VQHAGDVVVAGRGGVAVGSVGGGARARARAVVGAISPRISDGVEGLGAADIAAQDTAVVNTGLAPIIQQLRISGTLAHAIPNVLVDPHFDAPARRLLQRHAAAEVGLVARQDLVAPRAVSQLVLRYPSVREPQDQRVGFGQEACVSVVREAVPCCW